ncbi:MAG: hypothetical protein ACLUHE_08505 [Christensenellales bacterium]
MNNVEQRTDALESANDDLSFDDALVDWRLKLMKTEHAENGKSMVRAFRIESGTGETLEDIAADYPALTTTIWKPSAKRRAWAGRSPHAYPPDTVVQAANECRGCELDYQRDVNIVINNLETRLHL